MVLGTIYDKDSRADKNIAAPGITDAANPFIF